MMGKRKGKTESYLSTNSKGKRLRENGRLKIQDNNSDLEEMHDKLLRDAGVDEEMMKTIPEIEKQAIIKAICESKTQPSKDVIVLSQSDENGESSSVSPSPTNDEEETQPPDDFGMCETPAPLHPDTQSEGEQDRAQKVELSIENTLRGRSQLCSSSDNSNSSTSLPDMNIVCIPCDEDVTQPYQLGEFHSSVLAAETQFFPCRERDRDYLDVIPESPSTASPDNQDEEVDEKCSKADCGSSNQSNFLKSRTNQQEFPPRYSPESIKDPSIYTQVIKLMFDVYSRRLRSVQNCLKGKSLQWGKPVRKGIHCEYSLRREVLDQENKESKSGRGRRVTRRKSQKERDKNPQNSSKGVSNEVLPLTVIDDDEDEPGDKERNNDDQDFVDKFVKNKTKKVHIIEIEKTGSEGGRGSRYMRRNQARENHSTDDLSTETEKKSNEDRKCCEQIMKPQNMFKGLFNDEDEPGDKEVSNDDDFGQDFVAKFVKNKTKKVHIIETEKTGNEGGRGSKYMRRNQARENHSTNDLSTEKKYNEDRKHSERIMKPQNMFKGLFNESAHSSVIVDDEKLDNGATTDCTNTLGASARKKMKRTSLFEIEEDFSNTKSKRKKKNLDSDRIVTNCPDEELDLSPHPSSNTLLKKKNDYRNINNSPDEGLDLSPHPSSTLLSSKQKADKDEMIQDIEVWDGNEKKDSKSKDVSGSWLSSEKGRGIKSTTVGKRQRERTKDRPDSPLVEACSTSILKRKVKQVAAKSSSTLLKAVIPEDICIIEDNGDISSLPDLNYRSEVMELDEIGDNEDKAKTDKCDYDESVKSLTKGHKTEDLPSSLESGYFLDPKGDMYCTQFDPKAKETMKRRSLDRMDEEIHQTLHPSTSTFVCISSRRKKRGAEVDDDAEITTHDSEVSSNKTEKTKRLKRRRKQSNINQESQGEDNNPTNMMNLENDDYAINQDHEVLNESAKGVKPDLISSSTKKVTGKNTCLKKTKKRKRTLFDVDISEETVLELLRDDVSDRKEEMGLVEKVEQSENPGTSREEERIHCEDGGKRDDHMETNVDRGTCPICEKMFLLTDLEAHASTCGEGELVNADDPMIKCVICQKEIDREIMKEHQAHCANVGEWGEPPTKRTTRAKKSGHQRFFSRDAKSPSSSGEDYGELYVELDKEKK